MQLQAIHMQLIFELVMYRKLEGLSYHRGADEIIV